LLKGIGCELLEDSMSRENFEGKRNKFSPHTKNDDIRHSISTKTEFLSILFISYGEEYDE